MSIQEVRRVLMVVGYIGFGVPGDPCRLVRNYIDPETAQVLDSVDDYVNAERLRIIQESQTRKP